MNSGERPNGRLSIVSSTELNRSPWNTASSTLPLTKGAPASPSTRSPDPPFQAVRYSSKGTPRLRSAALTEASEAPSGKAISVLRATLISGDARMSRMAPPSTMRARATPPSRPHLRIALLQPSPIVTRSHPSALLVVAVLAVGCVRGPSPAGATPSHISFRVPAGVHGFFVVPLSKALTLGGTHSGDGSITVFVGTPAEDGRYNDAFVAGRAVPASER